MKQGKGAGTPVAGIFGNTQKLRAQEREKRVAVEIEEGEASAKRGGVSSGALVAHASS